MGYWHILDFEKKYEELARFILMVSVLNVEFVAGIVMQLVDWTFAASLTFEAV